MEIYFENVYTDSEEMFREITSKIGMKKSKHWIWVYLALAVYYAVFLLPNGSILSWLFFLLCIGYIAWILILPIYRSKTFIKKSKEYYNGTIPQTIVQFRDEAVTVTHGDSVGTVPYDKISKVFFLNHSIVLQADKMATVVLSTSGFTKGTLKEFQSFIAQKCPKIKLPDWQW